MSASVLVIQKPKPNFSSYCYYTAFCCFITIAWNIKFTLDSHRVHIQTDYLRCSKIKIIYGGSGGGSMNNVVSPVNFFFFSEEF